MREMLPADTAVMKRHIMDYQGLFLKQYGAQRPSLLPVIPQGEFHGKLSWGILEIFHIGNFPWE